MPYGSVPEQGGCCAYRIKIKKALPAARDSANMFFIVPAEMQALPIMKTIPFRAILDKCREIRVLRRHYSGRP